MFVAKKESCRLKNIILILLVFTALSIHGVIHAQGNAQAPAQNAADKDKSKSNLSPRELMASASAALAAGDFNSAITYLSSVIEMLGSSTNQNTLVMMDDVYYKLATCYFFTGQFAKAEESFGTYLKKYPTGKSAIEASVYIADSLRFQTKNAEAVKKYLAVLEKYKDLVLKDLQLDIRCAVVRIYILQDNWDAAQPYIREVFEMGNAEMRNWAASLWFISYLKNEQFDDLFRVVPYLIQPDSVASRSVGFNVAAIQTGDALFTEQRYREALWIYRLVYPRDLLLANAEQYKQKLEKDAVRNRTTAANLRTLMRIQEHLGEIDNEIKAIEGIENYDTELMSRIARAYMETKYNREAREIFLYQHATLKDEKAEEALYFAFRCCLPISDWKKTFELGEDYMKKYPAGRYFDQVTLIMGQVYARLQDWPEVIRHFTRTLEMKPNHEDGAECMYILGYAHFMEEHFEDAIKWLTEVSAKYPGNPREEDILYWLGMAHLFNKQFKEGAGEFEKLLKDYPKSTYAEDATFRRAVCYYGLGDFETAKDLLAKFAEAFPKSKLTGESYMMQGDIAAFSSDLRKAVGLFRQASEHELNIEQYNYCMFRSGEILFSDFKNYDAVIKHFTEYEKTNREGSNIPQAIYWIGRSYWEKGEHAGAFQFYRDAVEKYGDKRAETGIDMIIEDWIGRIRQCDEKMRRKAWTDIADALGKAKEKDQKVLALRLMRALYYQPDIPEAEKDKRLGEIVQEKNLKYASPGVLELIRSASLKEGGYELAEQAANEMIKAFPETDYALQSRLYLSEEAIKKRDYKTALKHLNLIREVFATQYEAAVALSMLGRIYLDEKKYAQADECFRNILGVKEWKGRLWPEALYGRAEVAKGLGKNDEACAFYERIYVLYSNYKDWTVKAYLGRADVLVRLREYKKAAETLEDMLSKPEFASLPEAAEAQKQLETIKKKL